MSSQDIDWSQLEGKVIPRSFSAGYVVLSYLVSYVGAWTTLEIIHRRTAMRGYYNWLLLLAASISMGGIAIWCMHFIGNRAIVLGAGQSQIQISYSAGFTALSFFIPVLIFLVTFWAVGSNESVSVIRLSLGGTLAGLGICGMHYLGQAGIANYDCIYTIPYVIGAAIIAVGASIGALGAFFLFRSSWETSWWKRALCSVLLAGAVSGMHWLASVGTQYRLRKVDHNLPSTFTRNSPVIVVIVLSVSGCFILLLFTFLAQRQKTRTGRRAEQIVLAAVVFDSDGKLLVTHQGLLPNRKITNQYLEQSFDDVFNVAHPLFFWMFRTTRDWSGVANLLPGMRNHLNHSGLKARLGSADPNLLNEGGNPIDNYHIVFRELFCIAAADLANDLNQPLENAGILYDEILNTGQKPKAKKGEKSEASTVTSSVDIERQGAELPTLGKGQLLFLVSKAGRREAEHLQGAGYRFATLSNVVPILAASMQVSRHDLTRRFDIMRDYGSDPHMLDPGVHLACFAIRAALGVGRKGFDVLARKDARSQLPTMQVPVNSLEGWQVEYIYNMDALPVSACIKFLLNASKPVNKNPKEREFAKQLLTTLEALKDEINEPFFDDATLIGKPVEAPCRPQSEDAPPGTCTLITFKIIMPIHSRPPGKKLEFEPLEFFKMQQHVFKNSPSHAAFARKTYREFAPVLDFCGQPSSADDRSPISSSFPKNPFGGSAGRRMSRNEVGEVDDLGNPIPQLRPKSSGKIQKTSKIRFWENRPSRRGTKMKGDNSSEKNLVDVVSHDTQTFGGIMVSQEVSVDVGARRSRGADAVQSPHSPGSPGSPKGRPIPAIELRDLPAASKGVVVSKITKEGEDETYVDELFAIVIATKGKV